MNTKINKGKGKKEKRFTEASDGRNVGEFSVANALRDGEAGDGEAGEEVGEEEAKIVSGKPFEDGDEVLYAFLESTNGSVFILELPQGVVWKKGFFHPRLQLRHEPPRRREAHRVPATPGQGGAALGVRGKAD